MIIAGGDDGVSDMVLSLGYVDVLVLYKWWETSQ